MHFTFYFNHKAGYIWTHQFTLNWHYKNTPASFYDWIMLNNKLPTCENAEKLPEVPIYNQIVRSFHGYFNITFCSLEFYFHFIFFISELILRILNSSCVFYEEITQGHNVIFDLLTNDLSCTIKKKEYLVLIAHRAYLLILKRKVYCCFRFR